MAVDMFLKLDGIQGESTDFKHKDEIVLESFSWGETFTPFRTGGGGAGRGRVSMQDFHFTTRVSKATPVLMQHCAGGVHIPHAIITMRKAGEQPFEFLFYKLTDVLVTSVAEAGANSELPVDSISFAFAKISVEYKQQTPTGGLGASADFSWDLTANKKL